MTAQPAVGSIETKGFPGILAAADAMVKAGRITIVGYLRAGSARFTLNIRGDVQEVKTAMAAGIEAVNKTEGAALETWVIIARPHDNVVAILPIDYSEAVEPFRAAADGAIAPIRR
ncbi:MAG: carbon dioxide-concentrating mechanism protein CcmK [Microcystis aeruginosa Ma_QC_Ch_20071001_S25]|jgi:microcompartment protein CcmL/EutN|uniref:Carboxysome shell protein CcmK n=3 Tax=Microcystis aeruginosa TaxID=1126 RepID=A0A552FNC9_MICAE|nr:MULTISPECIES: carbon dioxide-concentrating mechanism protein CcmK [unclassified Microcystis]MCA2928339.1 carbon dioxide-concentrating mechanism protein CcmK [Microcystis sp. M020S1]MCA2936910.1 carbon dioxide-concentrating mechanism protein CcmK [Microcystis sp. M015S1]MCU7245584.1 carbon dioxide-concentrating mechanism protein CcmK [Microcystis aeruginosa WS75]NCQ70133.1 carbon dioxide-concentrating mechanism protein CcmK [Microcystis aeruginosa W13-16]NCQ74670.1 carbon dioxide-concentrati